MKFLIAVLLSVFFFSCGSLRNEVDPDKLNKQAAKLVIASFISPQDSVLAVQISRSVPVLGTNPGGYNNAGVNDVTDATVTISNGAKFVALQFSRNYKGLNVNLYQVNARLFPILAGQIYTLTVETPRGEKATAQCTIPAVAPTPELRLDSAVVQNGYRSGSGGRENYYTKEYSVRLRWKDIVGQKNYYRTTGYFRFQPTPPANTTAVVPIGNQNIYFDYSGVQTDAPSTDGSMLTSREGVFYRPFNSYSTISGPTGTTVINSSTLETDPDKIQLGKIVSFGELTVSLLHTDENYYKYHDAVTRQGDTGDNPFAEPVQIPTNINGGLGCFAGYNRSTVVVKIK